MIKLTLSLCLAGSLGTLLRIILSQNIIKIFPNSNFPWGTLSVNLLGCFIAGLCWQWAQQHAWPDALKLIIFGGILAAFTTFSAFGLESIQLLQKGQWGTVIRYILASNIVGIGLVYLGYLSSKLFITD
eukprot:COSAG01_NODE_412_length_17370_cov_26.910196_17_plen_129_part_00